MPFHPCSSAFIRGQYFSAVYEASQQEDYGPPMNADERGSDFGSEDS